MRPSFHTRIQVSLRSRQGEQAATRSSSKSSRSPRRFNGLRVQRQAEEESQGLHPQHRRRCRDARYSPRSGTHLPRIVPQEQVRRPQRLHRRLF